MHKYALIQLGCLTCNEPTKIIAIFSHRLQAYKVYNLCYKENKIHNFKIIKVQDASCDIPELSLPIYIQNCSTPAFCKSI
jgi:hypothetical protein